MRFFTREAPTVLPCARRGSSVVSAATGGAGTTTRSATTDGALTQASSVGSTTKDGRASSCLHRAMPETPWEF